MPTPGIDGLQPGLWVPPGAPFCGQTSTVLVAQRSWLSRLPCPRSMTITKMAFFVTNAATADDACDVGIYSLSGTVLNLLGSSGSTTGRLNSTGLKTLNLLAPAALVAGQVYYIAIACGALGGSAAGLAATNANPFLSTVFGSSVPQIEQSFNSANFPLAASAAASGPITSAPILALLQ